MSTTIYYFSGTGNSLKVARDLADGLGDTQLVSIARANEEQLTPKTDAVGIVFPVYAWGPPLIVAQFLDKVNISPDKYVFSVCTCESQASGTLARVKKLLFKKGITLSSGFIVLMPSNYIIWEAAFPEDKQQEFFARAKDRIVEICAVVKERKVQDVEMGSLLGRIFLTELVYNLSKRFFAKMDKKFAVGEGCTGCGICERVCPVGNIKMEDGKPNWLHHCEQCLACLQWCPQEAIEFSKMTVGRKRYHHPEIAAKDLM